MPKQLFIFLMVISLIGTAFGFLDQNRAFDGSEKVQNDRILPYEMFQMNNFDRRLGSDKKNLYQNTHHSSTNPEEFDTAPIEKKFNTSLEFQRFMENEDFRSVPSYAPQNQDSRSFENKYEPLDKIDSNKIISYENFKLGDFDRLLGSYKPFNYENKKFMSNKPNDHRGPVIMKETNMSPEVQKVLQNQNIWADPKTSQITEVSVNNELQKRSNNRIKSFEHNNRKSEKGNSDVTETIPDVDIDPVGDESISESDKFSLENQINAYPTCDDKNLDRESAILLSRLQDLVNSLLHSRSGDKSVAEDSRSIAEDAKSVVEDAKSVAVEAKSVADDLQSVAEDSKNINRRSFLGPSGFLNKVSNKAHSHNQNHHNAGADVQVDALGNTFDSLNKNDQYSFREGYETAIPQRRSNDFSYPYNTKQFLSERSFDPASSLDTSDFREKCESLKPIQHKRGLFYSRKNEVVAQHGNGTNDNFIDSDPKTDQNGKKNFEHIVQNEFNPQLQNHAGLFTAFKNDFQPNNVEKYIPSLVTSNIQSTFINSDAPSGSKTENFHNIFSNAGIPVLQFQQPILLQGGSENVGISKEPTIKNTVNNPANHETAFNETTLRVQKLNFNLDAPTQGQQMARAYNNQIMNSTKVPDQLLRKGSLRITADGTFSNIINDPIQLAKYMLQNPNMTLPFLDTSDLATVPKFPQGNANSNYVEVSKDMELEKKKQTRHAQPINANWSEWNREPFNPQKNSAHFNRKTDHVTIRHAKIGPEIHKHGCLHQNQEEKQHISSYHDLERDGGMQSLVYGGVTGNLDSQKLKEMHQSEKEGTSWSSPERRSERNSDLVRPRSHDMTDRGCSPFSNISNRMRGSSSDMYDYSKRLTMKSKEKRRRFVPENKKMPSGCCGNLDLASDPQEKSANIAQKAAVEAKAAQQAQVAAGEAAAQQVRHQLAQKAIQAAQAAEAALAGKQQILQQLEVQVKQAECIAQQQQNSLCICQANVESAKQAVADAEMQLFNLRRAVKIAKNHVVDAEAAAVGVHKALNEKGCLLEEARKYVASLTSQLSVARADFEKTKQAAYRAVCAAAEAKEKANRVCRMLRRRHVRYLRDQNEGRNNHSLHSSSSTVS